MRLKILQVFVILRMRASRVEERISDSFARREAGSGSWSRAFFTRTMRLVFPSPYEGEDQR